MLPFASVLSSIRFCLSLCILFCLSLCLFFLRLPSCGVSVIRLLHFVNPSNSFCRIWAVQMFWSHSYIVLKLIIHGKKYILLTAPLTQNKNSFLLLLIC